MSVHKDDFESLTKPVLNNNTVHSTCQSNISNSNTPINSKQIYSQSSKLDIITFQNYQNAKKSLGSLFKHLKNNNLSPLYIGLIDIYNKLI